MTFYTVDCRCGQISFHLPIFPDDSALEGLLWNDKGRKEVLLLLKYSRCFWRRSQAFHGFRFLSGHFTTSVGLWFIFTFGTVHSGRSEYNCWKCGPTTLSSFRGLNLVTKKFWSSFLWEHDPLFNVASWRTTHSLPLNSKTNLLGSSCVYSGASAPDTSNQWVESSSNLNFYRCIMVDLLLGMRRSGTTGKMQQPTDSIIWHRAITIGLKTHLKLWWMYLLTLKNDAANSLSHCTD